MYVKTKKEKKERYWIPFILISSISFIIIYYLLNYNPLRIKTMIRFGHNGFLYLFNIKLYFIIIIFIFNYGNIYQILILFYSLITPQFLNSLYIIILEFIKQDQYYKDELNSFYNYFVLFFFFLILCQIIFYNNYDKNGNKNNINYKGIFIYISLFIFLVFCITNTIALSNSNIIFLDKIISAFLLSFTCFFFIFQVININQNDSMQLFYFIEFINNNIITVIFFVIIIVYIYLNQESQYNKFLPVLLYFSSMLIPLYGILYEYKSLFNSNRKNWINFNFEKEKEENENVNSLISEITITKPIKWNKTSFCKDSIRLVVLLVIQYIVFYFSDKLGSKNNNHKLNKAFIYFVSSILIFIVNKIILFWMNLINMTYFFLERNSINSK